MRSWLIAIRKEKNMTQNECARKSHIAQEFYCQIENGKRNPSVETAKAIATVLDFSWTKFFENES